MLIQYPLDPKSKISYFGLIWWALRLNLYMEVLTLYLVPIISPNFGKPTKIEYQKLYNTLHFDKNIVNSVSAIELQLYHIHYPNTNSNVQNQARQTQQNT